MSNFEGETNDTPEDGITVGCWLSTPMGEAVCVAIAGPLVSYRYSAVPFRDGKPQVMEQIWCLREDKLRFVKFLYPQNVVSAEVVKLKGPYGRGEPKVVQHPELMGPVAVDSFSAVDVTNQKDKAKALLRRLPSTDEDFN